MSVVLYGSQSTASLVVHWLLIELGIEHELRQLDFDLLQKLMMIFSCLFAVINQLRNIFYFPIFSVSSRLYSPS